MKKKNFQKLVKKKNFEKKVRKKCQHLVKKEISFKRICSDLQLVQTANPSGACSLPLKRKCFLPLKESVLTLNLSNTYCKEISNNLTIGLFPAAKKQSSVWPTNIGPCWPLGDSSLCIRLGSLKRDLTIWKQTDFSDGRTISWCFLAARNRVSWRSLNLAGRRRRKNPTLSDNHTDLKWTENRKQKTENRKQKTENWKLKIENRKGKTEWQSHWSEGKIWDHCRKCSVIP